MSDVRLLQKSNIYIYESFSGLPRKIRSLYVQSVEHAAVNRRVVGSSPTRGAMIDKPTSNLKWSGFVVVYRTFLCQNSRFLSKI